MGIQRSKPVAKPKAAEKRSGQTRAQTPAIAELKLRTPRPGGRFAEAMKRAAKRKTRKAVSKELYPITVVAAPAGVTIVSPGDEFSTLVQDIAMRFGVQVAPVEQPKKNPYAMSAEKAVEYAKKAGILTESGTLRQPFK